MIVKIVKHKGLYSLQIISGYLAGELVGHSTLGIVRWPTAEAAQQWARDTGYEVLNEREIGLLSRFGGLL